MVIPASSGHLHFPIDLRGPVLAPTLIITEAYYGPALPFDPKRRSDIPDFDLEKCIDLTARLQQLVDQEGKGQSLFLGGHLPVESQLRLEIDRLPRIGGDDGKAASGVPGHDAPSDSSGDQGTGDEMQETMKDVFDYAILEPTLRKHIYVQYMRRGIRGYKVAHVQRSGIMKGKIEIHAPNLQDSRKNKYAAISRGFGFSCPAVRICSASYGTTLGARFPQTIDVQHFLQHRIDKSPDNRLTIQIEENLDGKLDLHFSQSSPAFLPLRLFFLLRCCLMFQSFRRRLFLSLILDWFGVSLAPWAGSELRVNYEIPSFCVRLDLPVINQRLTSTVRIGYLEHPICTPAPVDVGASTRSLRPKVASTRFTGAYDTKQTRAGSGNSNHGVEKEKDGKRVSNLNLNF